MKSERANPTSDTESQPLSPEPPPDGGLTAWLQVFAGHLINAVTWGYATGFGVFQTHYEQTLGHSPSDISWIGGVQVFLLFFISTFSGRATDAGLARHSIFSGSVLLVVGTLTTSFATKYWQVFLAQGICVGIGLGLLWLPSVTLIATYFVRWRAVAVTLSAAGTGTGSIIFPIMVQYLTPKIGFGWSVRCMALVVLVFAIIFNLLFKTRLPPRQSGPFVELSAFKEAPYSLYCIGVLLLYWVVYFAFFYVQPYAQGRFGFSDRKSVDLIVIMNAVGMPVRPLLGYVSDRWVGPLNTLIPCTALSGICLYCWLAVSTPGELYGFVIAYGVFSAAAMSLFAATVPSLTDDLSKIGTRVGMIVSIMSFGPLTGPSVGGAIIQSQGDKYVGAFVWGGTVVIAAALFLAAARIAKTGFILKTKI
ncbi:putative monocarboxylate permease [Xylona heveae TC161]|uniref:Putative monocarboxylate permease n=1 Tax=Xylona heveae (strain CBS 132557 / TC161) TaxID=1328760 RepID=A0A165GB01_XYLHT|nr:putative monocarboxylate permease [Xylona heveae TC161]KZF21966.1 putative monocarboxylate permease [Xylona heveae TC161]